MFECDPRFRVEPFRHYNSSFAFDWDGFRGTGYLGTGRYPLNFRKFGYRWVPGTSQIKNCGYRWVPGTGQIKNHGYRWVPGTGKKKLFGYRWVPGTGPKNFFGYRWVPGTGQKKKFGYRWVPCTGKVFTYADPCFEQVG